MQAGIVFDQKDIDVLRKLADAAPEILAALGANKNEPATDQPGRWLTIEEVMKEIGCSKGHVHTLRKLKDFPYEVRWFSAKTVRYRLKKAGEVSE